MSHIHNKVIVAIEDECYRYEILEFDGLEAFLGFAKYKIYSFEGKEDILSILWYHNHTKAKYNTLHVIRGLDILEKAPKGATLFLLKEVSRFND